MEEMTDFQKLAKALDEAGAAIKEQILYPICNKVVSWLTR